MRKAPKLLYYQSIYWFRLFKLSPIFTFISGSMSSCFSISSHQDWGVMVVLPLRIGASAGFRLLHEHSGLGWRRTRRQEISSVKRFRAAWSWAYPSHGTSSRSSWRRRSSSFTLSPNSVLNSRMSRPEYQSVRVGVEGCIHYRFWILVLIRSRIEFKDSFFTFFFARLAAIVSLVNVAIIILRLVSSWSPLRASVRCPGDNSAARLCISLIKSVN